MVIQTLDKNYIVIKRCEETLAEETFICRDGDSNGLVTLLRTRDREVVKAVVEYISKEVVPGKFTDFKGYFTSGEYFCVTTEYHEGMTLHRRLEWENSTLKERLELFKNILEKVILLHMPDYFLCDGMQPAGIIVKSSLEVSFNYSLLGLKDFRSFTKEQGNRRIAQILELLFQKEFQKKTLPLLWCFYSELEENAFSGTMDVYRRYLSVLDEIAAMSPEQQQAPKTWPFRLWNSMKRFGPPIKRVLGVLFLIAAILYLIFTVKETGADGEVHEVFRYIGTVEITD